MSEATRERRAAPATGAPSCHEGGSTPAPAGARAVALAGAPNVGKSTLFNTLTGARRTVGNWPGTTVEVGNGACTIESAHGTETVALIDLPGAYSLDPMSPDEQLTRDVVLGDHDTDRPDAVVVVASAVHLARSLYLVAQIRETDLPVVVALTMTDVAARRGIHVDTLTLGDSLGCPVIALDPRRRRGHDELPDLVARAITVGRSRPAPSISRHTTSSGAADEELARGNERFGFIEDAVEAALHHSGETAPHLVGPDRRLGHRARRRSARLPRRHVDASSRSRPASRPRSRTRSTRSSSGPDLLGARPPSSRRSASAGRGSRACSSTVSSPASGCSSPSCRSWR